MLAAMPWRGPDGRGIVDNGPGAIGHLRLAIIDPDGGHQPLANEDESLWISFNGEVYNHAELRRHLRGHRLKTGSDAEVVLHLYEQEGPAALTRLLGMYAFAIWDRRGRVFLARDPVGIKPLYWGHDADGWLCFASEIKAMLPVTVDVHAFPPGHWYRTGEGLRPFRRLSAAASPRAPGAGSPLRAAAAVHAVQAELQAAVQRCLVSDVPVGVCLSGGLDSSLVAAIARRRHGPGLQSFAVGMAGSPDLAAARQVAGHLGTVHHELIYTPDEVVEALPPVIDHLESFDPPLVRSAVATWMVARLVSRHVKVVLTGEGADELFAGYHYLQNYRDDAPALAAELRRITTGLHNTNLQRADRESMAHSVEARVPFLELPLIDTAFAIDPLLHLGPPGAGGKWVLRQAALPYLPPEIVQRRKEKFSLGTGTGDFLAAHAAAAVGDDEIDDPTARELGLTLHTKEEALYWRHFRRRYAVPAALGGMGRSQTLGDFDRNPAAVAGA